MRKSKIFIGILIVTMLGSLLIGCNKEDVFRIGVSQLVAHAALDASYEGFIDELKDAGYIDGENIIIDYQNAQGDQSNTNTIATTLVNKKSDLILAIATPSAQAVANATKDIPILVTAVTDPEQSGLVESNEKPGGNVSGTSDLTPVKRQIELLTQLVPEAKNIIIGGNGAGKSTLLNMIAGVYLPDWGSINLDGKDITFLPEHKRAKFLGRVFQDPMMGTAANMEIQENLALASRRGKRRGLSWGITKEEKKIYSEKLKLLDLGLESRLGTKVGLLSGGQRQALTLLMSTLQNPKLLLLDEHTAALDPKTASKVLSLTDQMIKENSLTALMITHNMKDAIQYGNRLIMMHAGRIIYDISGEEKKNLKVSDLLKKFERVSGQEFANDRMILS